LSLAMELQEQDNWCWSAVSVSVKHFYDPGNPITQCQQAARQMATPCCDTPTSSVCNRPWFLDRALMGLGNLQATTPAALPIDAIRVEIDNHHPLGCRIGWAGGGGHFVCIDGYDVTGAVPIVTIRDPIYGTSHVTLTTFLSAYQGSGSWTNSYTTKA
ncbi:MAG TPA: papain-like cysteine protease family protein, partial [Thermoanaerobaculia bacterium]|nr:papain-like cysteine protease family protein [Thermoanaerobaculia bacterium]